MENDTQLKTRGNDARPDLAGEHIWGDLLQVILLVIFLAVWIIDSFFLQYSTFTARYVPTFVRIPTAIIILSVSGFLAARGLYVVFGKVREKPVVIRDGVFGLVRHPIYLSAILFYLGLLTLTLSIAATTVWVSIIAFYRFIARYEERLLLDKFGEEYEAYMRDVPMLIPRIIKTGDK